jgi:AcrR family transcriptional regulator
VGSRSNGRRRIVEAADRVWRRDGLVNTSAKQIATEADMSVGNLYNHFSDKVELLTAVIVEVHPTLVQTIELLLPGSATVREQLRGVLSTALGYYEDVVPLTASVFADPELMGKWQAHLAETDLGPHRPQARLAAYLAEEQRRGRISATANTDVAALVLLGSCAELARLNAVSGADRVGIEFASYADRVLDVVLGGLEP